MTRIRFLFCFNICLIVNSCGNFNSEKQNYHLIRDNLFCDKNGNLFLKTANNEESISQKEFDVWLNKVYMNPDENKWRVLKELKEIVDTNSFHYVLSDRTQGGDSYEDENYSYFHKWMADGGNIAAFKK